MALSYLSPTSVSLFYEDREQFYLQYLAGAVPRQPATEAMAVGSLFDFLVKDYMHKVFYGTPINYQPENHAHLDMDALWTIAKDLFAKYKEYSLGYLIMEVEKQDVKFELRVDGKIPKSGEFDMVPIVGIPDIYFWLPDGTLCVYDWKVNGYFGKSMKTPEKGYVRLLDCDKGVDCGSYKQDQFEYYQNIPLNISRPIEQVNESWARQLTTYAMLLATKPNTPFIIGIEQIACGAGRTRIASHRSRVSQPFIDLLLHKYRYAWKRITTGHIFDDMTKEQSDEHCETLKRALALPPLY